MQPTRHSVTSPPPPHHLRITSASPPHHLRELPHHLPHDLPHDLPHHLPHHLPHDLPHGLITAAHSDCLEDGDGRSGDDGSSPEQTDRTRRSGPAPHPTPPHATPPRGSGGLCTSLTSGVECRMSQNVPWHTHMHMACTHGCTRDAPWILVHHGMHTWTWTRWAWEWTWTWT
jgi:hypothetical protein